ncbi:MAG: aminotransferase class IV, partial [Chloroflexota bacterium]
LADSANREGINLTLSHGDLRGVIREVIRIAGYGDVKFRLTVPKATPDAPIISVEPFPGYPRSLYTDGVRMTSSANSARHNAAAKDTRWMHAREALRGDTDAYEVLLLDADGAMLEGTSSNFYAVKNDTLYTALEGVLAGTSRGIIFEVAPQVLPLVRRALHVDDVSLLQEAFITSSSRGIVPVVQIDDTTLGDGKPGPYTRQLMTVYRAWVADHLETL